MIDVWIGGTDALIGESDTSFEGIDTQIREIDALL